MKKLTIYTLLGIIAMIGLLVPVMAFTTPGGTEWNFIIAYTSKSVSQYENQWIPRVDYPNGTTIFGHLEKVYTGEALQYTPYVAGINISGKQYLRPINLFEDRYLSKWKVPIGDRNMAEFGRCRPYEIKKGVCSEDEI